MTSFAPSHTPAPIKILLGSIFFLSAFSFLVSPYFVLSPYGIQHLWIWQFVTYLFIHPFPKTVLSLAFNLYLIWIFGVSLLERLNLRSFFLIFFGSGIFAAMGAWLAMAYFSSSPTLFGSTPALCGLLIAWTILNPKTELILFFSLPFKAHHVILTLIGVNFLINLSHFNWTFLLADLGAIIFSYFFILITQRQHSPFSLFFHFENAVFNVIEFLWKARKKKIPRAKVYDIKSGDPIWTDEQFMDAMLARISLYGEEILTLQEKARMQQISESKSLEKPKR